jgi:hypothetical protein
MKTNNQHEGDLAHIAPRLSKIKKENSFEVPAGYFDTLPHVIQDICIQQTKQKVKSPAWYYFLLKPKFGMRVAMLAIALFFGTRFYHKQLLLKAPEDITQVYLSELDENAMVENIVDNDKQKENDKIEDYLIENQVDINDLK